MRLDGYYCGRAARHTVHAIRFETLCHKVNGAQTLFDEQRAFGEQSLLCGSDERALKVSAPLLIMGKKNNRTSKQIEII